MFCQFSLERRARLMVLLGGVLAAVVPAFAAPRAILPFIADTWNELARSPSRPMVVVFSTTDCAHCPKVIDDLAEAMRKARSSTRLVVVVMDGAGQEDALRKDRHYRKANALYVFDGDAMALRFKVNPDWRGLTPYVAFVPAAGAARFHAGPPPSDALRTFLRP
ncbi:MAG: thioredoxin family protein [Rhodocyclales bacterium]|nr:thioredoxin family protein [Rhodocyclales bacterium]